MIGPELKEFLEDPLALKYLAEKDMKSLWQLAQDRDVEDDMWDADHSIELQLMEFFQENNKDQELFSALEMVPALYYGGKPITEATIPAEVKEIGDYAFTNCTRLKDLYIYSNYLYMFIGTFEDANPDMVIHTKPKLTLTGNSDDIKFLEDHRVIDL